MLPFTGTNLRELRNGSRTRLAPEIVPIMLKIIEAGDAFT